MTPKFNSWTTPEIEAEASTCDYAGTCAVIERMKMLEEKDAAGNITELSGIYGHIFTHCNDESHPQCIYFRNEMLKTYDVMV
ncbi:hypothetical protein HYT92_03555 [Candidatus Pacearchaeota archaeon]|nr:hypothetical protein [Candidatus Pacearchaeota archaeon]